MRVLKVIVDKMPESCSKRPLLASVTITDKNLKLKQLCGLKGKPDKRCFLEEAGGRK